MHSVTFNMNKKHLNIKHKPFSVGENVSKSQQIKLKDMHVHSYFKWII